MEKIQAALEKARASRGTGASPVARSMADAKAAAGKMPQPWMHLKEINLSGEALAAHRVVTQTASGKAAPFDIMRTKILLQMQQNGWKTLAITSPLPSCGKTTIACNLALGVGRQSGLRAILFDMDLQNPSVAKFLGYTPDTSISDMLSENVAFADQAVRIGENIAVSASRQGEMDPTRILLSKKTGKVLDDILSTYTPDIAIFDMPSILVGDNTRAFLNNVDCALIIARADGTRYGHFDTCEREVAEHTNVLGTVLNAFRTKNAENYMEG